MDKKIKQFKQRRAARIISRLDSANRMDKDTEDYQWITVNGAHVPIDDAGNVQGGANGALKGKNFNKAKKYAAGDFSHIEKKGSAAGKSQPTKDMSKEASEMLKTYENAKKYKDARVEALMRRSLTRQFGSIEKAQEMANSRSNKIGRLVGPDDYKREEKHWVQTELAKTGKFKEIGSAPAEKSASTKNGVKMPKIKSDSNLSSEIHVSEEMASHDGFEDEFRKVTSKLKPSDYVYQTTPEGDEIACLPCFDTKFDNKVKFKGKSKSKEVQAIYDDLVKKGTVITNNMLDIAKSCGASLEGVEHSIKAGSHFAEKIDRVRKKEEFGSEVSDEQIARSLGDSVRFTMMSKHDDLVSNVKTLMSQLEDKGYEIVELDNKYFPPKPPKLHTYKGVHLGVKSPDGIVFEVQVHSKESMDVKNINHKIYEKTEAKDGKVYTNEEKAQMNEEMVENAAKLRDPKGIKTLKSFDKRKMA